MRSAQMPASPPSSFARRSSSPGRPPTCSESRAWFSRIRSSSPSSPELDPGHRAGQLGRAEVVPGETWQPVAAADGVGAVVHVERDIQEVVAIGDQHAALAGRDDLVELQAERARVAERAQTAAAIARAGRLAHVLDRARGRAPSRSHTSSSMSAGAPRMWTGRIARVRGVSRRSTSAGSSVSESSTSASTGIARWRARRSASHSTYTQARSPRRPRPTPAPISAQMSADEPALTQSACFEPDVLCELALEGEHFVRPLADAVVAEEVLARRSRGPAPRAPPTDLHPAGEHRRLRPRPRRRAPVPRKGQLTLGMGRRGHASRPFWT